jgi:hypothetical protein
LLIGDLWLLIERRNGGAAQAIRAITDKSTISKSTIANESPIKDH